MLAGRSTNDVPIPDVVRRIAVGRQIQVVWQNALGGLTFELGTGPQHVFVKPTYPETCGGRQGGMRRKVPFMGGADSPHGRTSLLEPRRATPDTAEYWDEIAHPAEGSRYQSRAQRRQRWPLDTRSPQPGESCRQPEGPTNAAFLGDRDAPIDREDMRVLIPDPKSGAHPDSLD